MTEYAIPTYWRAEIARLGLHDLVPYENHDGKWVDPFADPEIRDNIRNLMKRLLNTQAAEMCARCGTWAKEFNVIDGKRYCHRDTDRTTCYQFAQRTAAQTTADENGAAPEAPDRSPVVDLMAALEDSLKAAKSSRESSEKSQND